MLIAFSGLKGSGKDTAAEVLVNEYGFTRIAFADAVRETAIVINPIVWADPDETGASVRLSDVIEQFGWDFSKRTYGEVRRLLQIIGTEVGRMLFGENVWIDILKKRFPDINSPEVKYVITDCRFDNEVDFVHASGGDVCWINRPGLTSDGHSSENTEIQNKTDYTFNNDSDINEFKEDVRFFMFLKGVEFID